MDQKFAYSLCLGMTTVGALMPRDIYEKRVHDKYKMELSRMEFGSALP